MFLPDIQRRCITFLKHLVYSKFQYGRLLRMQKLEQSLNCWELLRMDNRIKSYLRGFSSKFPDIFLLHILQDSSHPNPYQVSHHIKSGGKCSSERKWKRDSCAAPQQKQGMVTTSRSLNVIYVRDITQGLRVTILWIIQIIWIDEESFWLLQDSIHLKSEWHGDTVCNTAQKGK